MPQKVRIALDAMGGDVGASVVIPGAAVALARHPDCEFLLFGDQARIAPELEQHAALKAAARVIHTDVAVGNHEKPSQALRRGRKTSSMWLAIEAVKKGEADVAISAGNTGALVAMARFCLHMLEGIDRPALAAIWPTLHGECVVLDLGATIGADARHLVALAAMGSAMASARLHIARPKVGLLNIGTEQMKGHEEIREAGDMLRAMNLPQLDYIGFVEGDGIGKGAADVVVTEGFCGNVALKAAEGTARQVVEVLRGAIQNSLMARIGYLLARGAFQTLRNKMDPRKGNGSVLLGLNGIVVKSHGGTDAEGFASAVGVGYEMARYDLLTKINQTFNREGGALASVPAAQEAVS
ncbi:MAG: phosphate acyltransferase PlsX [Bradyrhizobium sp.]|jgi:phosphate acyltransferase|uniref:phosphate acyltransferase PlsX n=1 Tax=Bradyrhizobium sp. TaxID=376 RepID=UPI003C7D837B